MTKQRTSFTLTISFDVLQILPDEATHADVINEADSIKITLERHVIQALTEDYGYHGKIIVTSLPKIK